ncbi:hypothetical protein [Algoriphagus aquimarinus]|uniref:Uncharacterized protein n=1 Tax=Algoriphagus aquimarinus TaxID=237018 RepID=A0A5C7AE79_9BACT|nr:hypothetical protein [Algoriphagus aquimarinus]TXE05723.1 hypothetical protein ESV85_17460 [Algoriphagus aquimarinus]|tara:strand:+ start:8016 stop:8738 length:723 start_codon:yes stop_codon:yes gene_type:complete
MLKINFFTPFILFFIWTASSFAQSQTYLSLYKEQLPYFQEIITGGQYKEPPLNYEGNPYYLNRKFGMGSLSINKITYTEVPLLYDENADAVITFHPIHRQKILIKPEKIEEVQLEDGSVFRRLEGNDSYGRHKNGFYRVLQDGEIKVLMKYYKYIDPTKEVGKFTHSFVESTDYFYWHAGDFVLVRKKKQAIKSLGLSKREVNKHMRDKSIYFSTDKEKYIVELARLKDSKAETFNGFVE